MFDLRVGMEVIHNGTPLHLMYRQKVEKGAEVWRVRPLFVEIDPEYDEVFADGDRLVTKLHGRGRGN